MYIKLAVTLLACTDGRRDLQHTLALLTGSLLSLPHPVYLGGSTSGVVHLFYGCLPLQEILIAPALYQVSDELGCRIPRSRQATRSLNGPRAARARPADVIGERLLPQWRRTAYKFVVRLQIAAKGEITRAGRGGRAAASRPHRQVC